MIGEASAAMSQNFIANHPEIPCQDMSDFRKVIVHEYFRIDPKIVWTVVIRDLPILKIKIMQILYK